jgi:hypothetical protein
LQRFTGFKPFDLRPATYPGDIAAVARLYPCNNAPLPRINSEPGMTNPDGKNTLTLVVVIPWILALLTALLGIWQFTAQQSQANRQPFLQKQLDLSFKAVETAGQLASETDPVEWEKARVAFWGLYWGPLSIVEDLAVESAMADLGNLIPREPVKAPKLPMDSLGKPSYRLAHAVRDLLLNSWNVKLPPLQGKRNE